MPLAGIIFAAFLTAVAVFTPLSGVICGVLVGYISGGETFTGADTDLGEAFLSLAFPIIGRVSGNDAAAGKSPEYDIPNGGDKMYSEVFAFDDSSAASDFDIYDYYAALSGVRIGEASKNADEVPAQTYTITSVNLSGQKDKAPRLLISNQTSYNINLDDYLAREYPIAPLTDADADEPVVLILNTHATESYVNDGVNYYTEPFTAERTTDSSRNVMLIARCLETKLKEYGIPVVRSEAVHDAVSFTNSYLRSLETMEEYKKKYPSIKYVIDLHRDSIIRDSGEKLKPAISVNGKDSAQVMLVVGTDDGGASHQLWKDNLTFAAYLQQTMNEKYPMLARPINLRAARFNQHVTTGSVILEVGSCGSTFSEAIYAAELFGECLAEVILRTK
ncbi:hypothetical protein FACS1894105_06550 [Clostridia bacterium]|nr:hypothetical protein FACS1894105_06550 [Clostridia bacterium]